MKKKLAFTLALTLLLTALFSGALADAVYGTIRTKTSDGSVNIRAQAGVQHQIVGWAKNGAQVEILYYGNTWHKVKVLSTGRVGWVYASYVRLGSSSGGSSSDTSSVNGTVARVTTKYENSTVNVRYGAGTQYAVAASVKRGTRLSVLATSGNWYQVYIPSKGVTGWISKSYVTFGLAARTTGNVNMRTGAGTDYSRLTTISKGTNITVIAVGDGWSQVSYNGKTGYISNRYWQYR